MKIYIMCSCQQQNMWS